MEIYGIEFDILSNQVQCDNCGDTPWSQHRHDLSSCECGMVSVDGGQEYLRRVHRENATYTEHSILVQRLPFGFNKGTLVHTIAQSMDSNRNPYGVALAALRGIRDAGMVLEVGPDDEALWIYEEANQQRQVIPDKPVAETPYSLVDFVASLPDFNDPSVA